jgi:uncharacterized DUF497 family protein
MKFEWDENKNRSNQKKHGLRFETASLVFQDPHLISVPDHRYEEERWCSVGLICETIVYVAHTVKEDNNDEEIIRIISARGATPGETKRYYLNRRND